MDEQPPEQSPVVKCPTCPLCGSVPPFIWPSMAQAWCPNEDCDVLMWIPWDSLEENLMDARRVRHFINGEEQE